MFFPGFIALLLVASTPTAKAGGERDAVFSGRGLGMEIGGPGDAQRFYQRKQIAADVQWRFWGVQGVVRPWVGLGMAWGSIHEQMAYTSYPSIDADVWEYFRFGAGVDLVPVRWVAFP